MRVCVFTVIHDSTLVEHYVEAICSIFRTNAPQLGFFFPKLNYAENAKATTISNYV